MALFLQAHDPCRTSSHPIALDWHLPKWALQAVLHRSTMACPTAEKAPYYTNYIDYDKAEISQMYNTF